MPKYCIFDTETTGLFLFKDPDTGAPIPADDPRQPRLAHFNAILINEELEEEDEIDLFVKPDGWEMPQGEDSAGSVNGLTTQFLQENGTPIDAVLDLYSNLVQSGYIVVAYNAQFDCKMMRGELRSAGRPDLFDATPNICAMRAATAPGRGGLSPPRRGRGARGGGGFSSRRFPPGGPGRGRPASALEAGAFLMKESRRFPVQYMLRLPEGMREQISADATANSRSLNAEIVARLSGEQRTLRDWFAGQVAAGMAAFSGTAGVSYGPGEIAGRAYQVADAMLAARKGTAP